MISALKLEGLALTRGERRLFEGFDAEIAAGEAVALTGANGSGKTSLLRAIAGFLHPTAGAIRFEGPDGPLDPIEARRGATHLIGHQDGLKTSWTPREELHFQSAWCGGGGVAAAVEAFDLGRLMDLEIRKLSAGQRRRVALARLTASPRALWLLDEPMAPLDAEHRALFGEVMGAHLAGGGLIIAAVHDPLPVPARFLEIPR